MCGICGVAGGDPALAAELVSRMCAAMTHRGPDDDGSVSGGGVTLGMRRLSIIDVEGGHQPMANEDGRVLVVHNGEIFNHLELRAELARAGHSFRTKSDTEVLVHGWEEWGPGVVGRLNGQFAFAVHDRRRGVVFLARDRMGIKPLHWAWDGDRLVFASELKALLQAPNLRRGVDPVALDAYLAFDFVPSPRTIVRDVNKLPAAGTLTCTVAEGRAQVGRYWQPALNLDLDRGTADLGAESERLLDVLRESVRKELISDVPLGVFLSGGIDSSAVAAMMTSLAGGVKTFSVGFAERSFDESDHARLVARHLGTEHHEMTLEPADMIGLVAKLPVLLDEPLGDASIIPTYLLSAFTRRHVKVALGGDGGDELFAGYPTLQAHRLAGWYMRAPSLVRRGLVEPAVPLSMKLRGMKSKFLLKRALRGVLPDSILDRPKKGFGVPVAEWFRGPLREQMLDVLSPDRMSTEGFFRPEAVRGLVDEHLAGRADNRKQLWTLFAFEMWLQGYATRCGSEAD